MPLTGDEYEQWDRDSVLAFLEAELRSEFGEDIDLTESSVFRTFADTLSTMQAEEVEPAIGEVHAAAAIEDAEGELLERLVDIYGVSRREAIHSTGLVRFNHDSIATQTYTVPNGTVVQTGGSNPIEFETAEVASITFFDDFEAGSLDAAYGTDGTAWTVVDGSDAADPEPTEGGFMAKSPAEDGAMVYTTSADTEIGDEMAFQCYLGNATATDAAYASCFGVVDASNYYRVALDSSGGHRIEKVTAGSPTTLDSTGYSVPTTQWLRHEVDWLPADNGTIVSRILDGDGNVLDEIETTDVGDDISVGGFGFESLDGGENKYVDHSGCTATRVNIRATEPGPDGNVARGTITDMPTVPSGVQSVTNPHPTGDDTYYQTDLIQFTLGLPEETDNELRERVRGGGAVGEATVPAIITEARALDGAESVSVYENKTNTDNTGSGGLPPKSFELVFYGTTPNQDIADMLHDVRAFTARDYGGANGAEVTADVQASNGQTFTMHWSEPTNVDVDMTLDIVVNEDFIGEDDLRDRIVSYIGGTRADGTTTLGTGTGGDVYVDQIEDVVTGPTDTGVIGVASYSFTPSVTTDSNGLEVVSIGANEVASTNAQDGSIALNITEV